MSNNNKRKRIFFLVNFTNFYQTKISYIRTFDETRIIRINLQNNTSFSQIKIVNLTLENINFNVIINQEKIITIKGKARK